MARALLAAVALLGVASCGASRPDLVDLPRPAPVVYATEARPCQQVTMLSDETRAWSPWVTQEENHEPLHWWCEPPCECVKE